MTPPNSPSRRRRATRTLLAFVGVGIVVSIIVLAVTESVLLGLAYGVGPGLALGGLAWLRVVRGGLFSGPDTQDNSGPLQD